MTYLLIAIILAIILSPLLSLRSSNRLQQQAALRRCAAEDGVQVQLARKIDAREDEVALEAVCYRLSWGKHIVTDASGAIKGWTLTHDNQRGMAASWPNWRWFEGPAPSRVDDLLNMVVPELPKGIDGIKVNRSGVAIFWDEKGTEIDVISIVTALKILRDGLSAIDLK